MIQKALIIIVATLFIIIPEGQAQIPNKPDQQLSNLRVRKLAVAGDTLRIDTLSIIPGTLSIAGVDKAEYELDYVNGLLVWKNKPALDSINLSYRVFYHRLNAVVKRLDYDSVSYRFYQKPFQFNQHEDLVADRSLFDFGDLQYNGSLGRGISFGNNQDAVVNSNLNLTLNGMLGDSIQLSAAITDNNIPIQPDGSTQQLNEFDQVFLQFSKKDWKLDLGDIDIRQNQNYFLNFYKRLQGVSFESINKLSSSSTSSTLVSGSIAKGKFTRNVFQGLEGNQGPYRLTGANNEFFFIVLAGTERVFIDGELLQRGEDQDYVINYNTAEITFTPRRMITKDSRIQVEFEYADRNFLNANLYLSQDFDINKKTKFRIGAFNNSDAKNSQINQQLDPQQKFFLSQVGDSIQDAYYPSAYIDTAFDAGKILYEKQFYSTGSGTDSFYVYSTNPAVALYALSFVDLGEGNGNYVPEFNGANGKVYRFVMPVSGIRQGRYEPVMILVTPKKQQVVTLGVDHLFGKNTMIKTDFAMSNYDVNTFSSKNSGDDLGFASKILLTNISKLRGNESRLVSLNTNLEYEFVQSKFRPVERLRYVEFARDWGLDQFAPPADEHIVRGGLKLLDNKGHSVSYQLVNYSRSDNYNGLQQFLAHKLNWKGWLLNNQVSLTGFKTPFIKGKFFRPIVDLSKELKQFYGMRLGVKYTREENESRNRSTDTLSSSSFSFQTWTAYLRSSEKRKNRYGLGFYTRTDEYPSDKRLIRGDRSYNYNFMTELISNPRHQFLLNVTYRTLSILDDVSKQKPDETILGRGEYIINEWKGLITGNLLYELGTGQEQRRDYAYLEVPAGTGQFTWIDYNSDGVQQLNEFEEAIFTDQAKFIRVFTPTNDFIKANYTTFNYSFRLNPRSVLNSRDLEGFKKLVSRFTLQSSLQVSKKSVSKGNTEFSPFKYEITDTALITLYTVILNTVSFNRFSSKWGMDLSNLRNNGKSLLTYGYESRKLNDWILKFRWNLSRSITIDIAGKQGLLALYTPSFSNRNYEVEISNLEPRIVFIQGTRFRFSSGYKFENKSNNIDYGGEKSTSNSVQLETKYNVVQNSSITGRFIFNKIDFDYPTNTAVSYIMLEGLLPGSNYLWNLELTKRLLNNLELTLQYEGRKPGSANTVHVGRAGVRALF